MKFQSYYQQNKKIKIAITGCQLKCLCPCVQTYLDILALSFWLNLGWFGCFDFKIVNIVKSVVLFFLYALSGYTDSFSCQPSPGIWNEQVA